MSLKSICKEIRRTFTRWNQVENVPDWAWKSLDPMSLPPFGYRVVKGKTYLYKAWRGDVPDEQGPLGVMLYRKKRIR